MRKLSNKMILILLLSSIVIPFFPVTAQLRTAQIPTLRIGVAGDITGNWDSPVSTGGFSWQYASEACEPLFETPPDFSGDYNEMIPVLATNWTLIPWEEEWNYHPTDPFINKNGLKALDIVLRENVTFHDGSDFNATVAKWNYDRDPVIAGNITGKLGIFDVDVYKSRYGMWIDALDWVDYETDSWNVSQYIGQPASYAEYGSTLASDMFGKYSRIRNVTITENKTSGGKIRIYFNDWGGAGTQMIYVMGTNMISMAAYKDYFETPIYGVGDIPEFPQPTITGSPDDYPSTGFPGHMIGTGPYIYVLHDTLVLQGGVMKRNPNWWNSSAMQAQGWHQVPEIRIVTYPLEDWTIKNLAMVTGTIDLAYNTRATGKLDPAAMILDDDIDYFDMGLEAARIFITLNAINETDWKTWADLSPDGWNAADSDGPIGDQSWLFDVDDDGTIHIDGINRALRKALCYAFDYDTYINNIKQGQAVRTGGFLPKEHEFYNPNIPIASQDFTIARQALIDDLSWEPLITARNLDINNHTDDWIWVAENDPIFEFKLLWDQPNLEIANLFSTSIKNLGLTLGGPGGAPDPDLEIKPYIYAAMFFRPQNYPFFTSHGVPTSWSGGDNLLSGILPALEYYYKSPGLPFENKSGNHFPSKSYLNVGFHYNQSVDNWLNKAWFAERSVQQELMDNLTRHFQTYQYSEIMVAQENWGIAIDKDWELDTYIWGNYPQYAHVKYAPGGDVEPGVQIPGFQTTALLAIAIVTISGIGYSLSRKRKHAEM